MGKKVPDDSDDGQKTEQQPVKYAIFFDVNMPKGPLLKNLRDFSQKVNLCFLHSGKNMFDENGKAPVRMPDNELLDYVLLIIKKYYPNAACFLFTFDRNFIIDAGKEHPAFDYLTVKIFTTINDPVILAERIIKSFKKLISDLETPE